MYQTRATVNLHKLNRYRTLSLLFQSPTLEYPPCPRLNRSTSLKLQPRKSWKDLQIRSHLPRKYPTLTPRTILMQLLPRGGCLASPNSSAPLLLRVQRLYLRHLLLLHRRIEYENVVQCQFRRPLLSHHPRPRPHPLMRAAARLQ